MWHALLLDLAVVSTAPQAPPPPVQPRWLAEVTERVDVYGRFDGNLVFSRDNVDVANNGSRFGFNVSQKLPGGLTAIGQGEWRINLGEGDTTYNLSDNPNTGFASLDSSTRQALETRLGFVGVRFGVYGTLTLGKQWGVYYDVSEWTDRFVVFGARSSSTYNAGTDGGQTGEGRANDAVIYRAAIGPVRLGLQAQFIDARDPVVDGLGASVIYDTGIGLRLGFAYSHAFLNFSGSLVGYDGGDPQALSSGLSFEGGDFRASALGTWTHNHETVNAGPTTVVVDTLGAGLFVSYRIRGFLMPYGGFDLAIPRGLDTRFVDPDLGTRDLLGGVRLLFDDRTASFAYVEARTGRTRDAAGEQAEDVVTLGIRADYSLRRGLGLD